jgi:hypothetical protein
VFSNYEHNQKSLEDKMVSKVFNFFEKDLLFIFCLLIYEINVFFMLKNYPTIANFDITFS